MVSDAMANVKARLAEHGLTMEHAYWGIGHRALQLLETIAAALDPGKQFLLTSSVTIKSGATTGVVAFKGGNAVDESWRLSGWTFKSLGAHSVVVEVYVESSAPEDPAANLSRMVDVSTPAATENVGNNNPPVPIGPGERVIFSISSATALDTIRVTVWGTRVITRPHAVAGLRSKK